MADVATLLQSFLAFCQTILCRMQHAMGAGELLRTWAHQCSRMTPTTFNEGRSPNSGDASPVTSESYSWLSRPGFRVASAFRGIHADGHELDVVILLVANGECEVP